MKIIQVVDLLKDQLVRVKETNQDLKVGDLLQFSNGRDKIVAKLVSLPREVPNIKIDEDYKFIAKLTEAEKSEFEKRIKAGPERVKIASEIARDLNLPMRFFASYVDFEDKSASFFFTSDDQVDFREFLKVLSRKIGKRVHLKRVGARDKSKTLGGMGICGRELCCAGWKTELESVPLNSARDQNLITRFNDKLFGLCGKLKCCLMYELPHYREMRKTLPHIKQKVVVVSEGRTGKVVGLDILNQKVKVVFEEGGISEVYPIDDIKIASSAGKK